MIPQLKTFEQKDNKAIKDTIIRDIRDLFEYEGDYYKPVTVIFGVTIILNMKVKGREIKHFQLKNILTKLDHT